MEFTTRYWIPGAFDAVVSAVKYDSTRAAPAGWLSRIVGPHDTVAKLSAKTARITWHHVGLFKRDVMVTLVGDVRAL